SARPEGWWRRPTTAAIGLRSLAQAFQGHPQCEPGRQKERDPEDRHEEVQPQDVALRIAGDTDQRPKEATGPEQEQAGPGSRNEARDASHRDPRDRREKLLQRTRPFG